jgi:hypothetical protein
MSAYRAMLKLARAPQSRSALKQLDKIRDAFDRASRMFGRTVLEDEIRSQDLLRETAKLAAERDHWSRQHDAARAELAGALQAKQQISLELNARAREASDLAPALAEQGRQREQAELALARETELMVTKKTRRAVGAGCDFGHIAANITGYPNNQEPEMLENKFERRFPTHQNAIDIFGDRWASNIGEVYPGLTSGPGPYFNQKQWFAIVSDSLSMNWPTVITAIPVMANSGAATCPRHRG